jgi:hypothetical protein
MDFKEERPDVRFWTTYDHFMIEREARAIRRRELRVLAIALWRKVKARTAESLKHAGAQPMKTRLETR